jgi:hypothetical protein
MRARLMAFGRCVLVLYQGTTLSRAVRKQKENWAIAPAIKHPDGRADLAVAFVQPIFHWVSTFKDHEYGGAAIGHDFGIASETCFFVRTTGAVIMDIRIDGHHRRSFMPQLPGKEPQEDRAVTLAKHVRLTDKGVDRSRSWRKTLKVGLRPRVHRVMLCIRKRPSIERNDLHDHGGFIEVFPQQRGLLFRFTPPPNDFRSPQPDIEQREVLFHHWAKGVTTSV